jgi:hypothetical protein
MVCFTSTFPLAVYWRKKPETHRRLNSGGMAESYPSKVWANWTSALQSLQGLELDEPLS